MTKPPAHRTFDDFDQFAVDYAKIHNQNLKISGGTTDMFSQERVALVCQQEDTDQAQKILDFGCGEGSTEVYFNSLWPKSRVEGIDISAAEIKVAQQRRLKRARFRIFDGQTIPFPDETFDIVFVAGVLHHVNFKYHRKQLKEMYRVLKPGGRLYIYEHNPINPLTKYLVATCEFDRDAILLPYTYLKEMARKAHFRQLTTNFLIFWPRFHFFRWLIKSEKYLAWLPLGGKYYLRAVK